MDEKTKVIEKKKNMKVYVVAGAVVLLLAVAIVWLFYYSAVSKPKKELQNQLDLGEKYLVELDYDNAILAYGEAIKMDPRSEKGYLGLAEAYQNKITAMESEGDYSEVVSCLDEAIPKMEEGFNNTGSKNIEKILVEFKERKALLLKKIEEVEENKQEDAEIVAEQEVIDFSTAKVGDIVVLGTFEQDANTENGSEPIEWEVLKAESNRIMVISKYTLDCQPFNTEDTGVTWETCSLRRWLNEDFYNMAFSEEEKAMIPEVEIINSDSPHFKTIGGNNTIDRLFCLSVDEVRELIGINYYDNSAGAGFNQKLIVAPTQYAIERGVAYADLDENYYNSLKQYGYSEDIIGLRGSLWWLRSPGMFMSYKPGGYSNGACGVSYNGRAGYGDGYNLVSRLADGVRPAMYIGF